MKALRIFIVAALLIPAAASAAMLGGAALSDRVAGGTLRTSLWAGAWPEHHIWRFGPDGTVRGIYHARNVLVPGTYYMEEHDVGEWTVEGDRLCIQWRHWLNGERNCFSVETAAGGWVRLTGARKTLEGTLSR